MAARFTIERVLRDDDDASGQSVRDWKIESEGKHITIRLKHGDGFILLRVADLETFITDLQQAAEVAENIE